MESLPAAKGFLIWISFATQAAFYHYATHKPLDCKTNGTCMAVIKRLLRTPQTRIITEVLRCSVLFELSVLFVLPT